MHTHEGLLRRHVCESNLIENIFAEPGDPEYAGHLIAARVAASGKLAAPNDLHRLLTRQIVGFGPFSGRYRTCGVFVGLQRMPHWREVPYLMDEWPKLLEQYLQLDGDIEYAAFFLHAWLLCIHPWVDGNGRIARLVWNMLRLAKGLPWHVEPACTKYAYYAEIRKIEIGVFKKEFPDIY